MLGIDNVGKTEIGHVLAGAERVDFTNTKGTRAFNINVKGRAIKLLEIGGAESVRDLWPHYCNEVGTSYVRIKEFSLQHSVLSHEKKKTKLEKLTVSFLLLSLLFISILLRPWQAYGIIYVIDCDKDARFDVMRELLQLIMRHKHVRQKPMLIVANKQDLSESLDLVDITYFFHIDEMANLLGTPTFLAACGHENYNDLFVGIDWLTNYIIANFNVLTNRMRFNRSILSPVGKLKRQMTSMPRKVSSIHL